MQAFFDVNLSIYLHSRSFFLAFMPAESSTLEGLALLWDTSFLMALIILVNVTSLRNKNFNYLLRLKH